MSPELRKSEIRWHNCLFASILFKAIVTKIRIIFKTLELFQFFKDFTQYWFCKLVLAEIFWLIEGKCDQNSFLCLCYQDQTICWDISGLMEYVVPILLVFLFFNLCAVTFYHLVDNWHVFLIMLLRCFSSPSYFFISYVLTVVWFSLGVVSDLVMTWVNNKTVSWVISDSCPCFLEYFWVWMGSGIAFH